MSLRFVAIDDMLINPHKISAISEIYENISRDSYHFYIYIEGSPVFPLLYASSRRAALRMRRRLVKRIEQSLE